MKILHKFGFVLALSALAPHCISATFTPLLESPVHLGGATPEWSIFSGQPAQGKDLRVEFNAAVNEREYTLFIRQDDVKQDWTVTLNGQKLGQLFLMEADLVHTLPVPAKALREGANELLITTKVPEDILIHSITLADDARTNVLAGSSLNVRVIDKSGARLPARITILDERGSLAALRTGSTNVAARPGVVYTPDGTATAFVLPGSYTVFATRGPEYSLAKEELRVENESRSVQLTLEREVNTTNWVASDTHIHTLSLSKHGDALLHERMITLAAEGIELPIATEHNLHGDYSPTAEEFGLSKYFTIVPGNEVTTQRGHFNIFPVAVNSTPIDASIEDWPKLFGSIRQSPGVRIAILNHPTDTHSGFTPFATTNFNRVTGKNLRGNFDFNFDAMEVINSGAMRSDWMEPFHCWFALLNCGAKIVGVGASDSHDVSRFIVGQGRTYIRGDDADLARLNVTQLCNSLKQGRAVVSLGLFPQLAISDAPDALDAPSLTTGIIQASASGPGDLHSGTSRFFEVTGSIDFPRWMLPEGRAVATIYENGHAKLAFPFEMEKQAGKPFAFKARFPKPKADSWYVLVAEIPGVTNAYWSIARPYQPSSSEWKPAMIGATNPIYLDANGDKLYSSPRQTAVSLRESYASPHDLIPALSEYDWAISAQVAELLHDEGVNLEATEFKPRIAQAAPHVQQAFADYLSTVARK
jgi:hypothetical protein